MAKASNSTSSKASSAQNSRTKACSSKLEAGKDLGRKSSRGRSSSCCGRSSRTSKTSK